MAKYILTFSKTGTICYTSHLDMMKMFKRVFKRAGIKQSYSQGFNPHPKMTFAQPLSLGYWGLGELLEFETEEDSMFVSDFSGSKENLSDAEKFFYNILPQLKEVVVNAYNEEMKNRGE